MPARELADRCAGAGLAGLPPGCRRAASDTPRALQQPERCQLPALCWPKHGCSRALAGISQVGAPSTHTTAELRLQEALAGRGAEQFHCTEKGVQHNRGAARGPAGGSSTQATRGQ